MGYSTRSEDLIRALEGIAAIGGNLPDEELTTRTGANDAVHRGLMYVGARHIAQEAIAKWRMWDTDCPECGTLLRIGHLTSCSRP